MNQTMTAHGDHSNPAAANRLRQVLLLDVIATGATAVLLTFGAGLLAPVLGLPATVLRYAGLVLVPFVAIVFITAKQSPPSRAAVRGIVAANVAWVLASVLLLVSGWVAPTALGAIFVLVQAAVVAGFAALQWRAL